MSQEKDIPNVRKTYKKQSGIVYLSRRNVLRTGIGVAVTSAIGVGTFLQSRTENSRAEGASAVASTIVVRWVNMALQGIRDNKISPSVSARLLAIVSTCMYDAWAAYTHAALGTRLGGSLRRYEVGHEYHYHKATTISYAAYRALADLVPGEILNLRAFMKGFGYNPDDISTDTSTPMG